MSEQETIEPRGPFSLRAAAEFGFGPSEGRPPPFDGTMRLAYAVDGGRGHAGVVLRQPDGSAADGSAADGSADDGSAAVTAQLTLTGGAPADAALAQATRIVSLDHDGDRFARVGAEDPVIGALQRAHPGQRPVLFHSPYEAAAWSIISARRRSDQAATVRDALAQALGVTFELDGRTLHAFPQPEALADVPDDFPGLDETKLRRLRAVAVAASAGDLDVDRIQELGPRAAHEQLQQLPGIGPFYATLITLRASGFADAWIASDEHRATSHVAAYYGLDSAPDAAQMTELSDRWRPFRTWALVLIRLAGNRGTRID